MTPVAADRLAVGIDAGGTKTAWGLVDADGVLHAHGEMPTPRGDPAALREALVAAVGVGLDAAARDDGRVVAVGCGLAGLVRTGDGVFVYGPNFDLRDEPVGAELSAHFGLRVTVDNDATVAAWAEETVGAGERCGSTVFVAFGTGIGGGVVAEGRLLRGAHGYAGEFGHMVTVAGGLPCTCGRRGCWETVASGRALTRAAEELAASPAGAAIRAVHAAAPQPVRPGAALVQAASDGDAAAAAAFGAFCEAVAVGLQSLVQAFDPARIVIGGGLAALGESFAVPVRAQLQRCLSGGAFRPPVDVRIATLGPSAGVVGAGLLALAEPDG